MNTETLELCVLCGEETPYSNSTHIDFRKGYIDGAGQLCDHCFTKHYSFDGFAKDSEITIPTNMVRTTPNNAELGEKIRDIYWEVTKGRL